MITTKEDWNSGDEATFEPFVDGDVVGYRCTVNGVVSYLYMNPSTCGDAPDVFIYCGDTKDPVDGDSICYVVPKGLK